MAIHILPLQTRVIRNARKRGVIVLTRRQWGTLMPGVYAERVKSKPVSVRMADTLWQHITVTFDDGVFVGDFKADMREVERIGYSRFRSGVSYNFVSDMKKNMIGVGMPLASNVTHTVNDKGAKAPDGSPLSYNQNLVARAIACLGMPGDSLSPVAKEAIAQLFAAMMDEGALTPDPDYLPHSWVAAKDCPTDSVRAAMPWILKRAHDVKKKRRRT